MPKVSVVIPVYGVERYIERCAISLFEQTLDEIEYVFIDDCSTDKSMQILCHVTNRYKSRIEKDNKTIKVIRMTTNSGQAAVRKKGILECTGDYIIHCDSDDWVDHDMYRQMYETAVNDGADMVVCDYYTTDGGSNKQLAKGCHTANICDFTVAMMFQRDSWALWNKLFKRSCYENIVMPKGNMGEDMVMTLQMIRNVRKMAYIDKPLYYYFFNPGSITNKMTVDKVLNNFYSLKDNTEIILSLYKENTDTRIIHSLDYLKFKVKISLCPVIKKDEKFRRLFLETYKDIGLNMLFMRNVDIKLKLVFFLSLIGLYPMRKK